MVTIVAMSRLPETTWSFRPGSKSLWTFVGVAAVPLWAAWPLLAVISTGSIPHAPDALTPGFGVSAVVAVVLHVATETTIIPPVSVLISAILVGLIPLAAGNLAWDYGVRRGDSALLATLAYATPLMSVLFLMAFGFSEPTFGLFAGGILIVFAGIISAR